MYVCNLIGTYKSLSGYEVRYVYYLCKKEYFTCDGLLTTVVSMYIIDTSDV